MLAGHYVLAGSTSVAFAVVLALTLFGPDPQVFDVLTWVSVGVFVVAAILLRVQRPRVPVGFVLSNLGLAVLCAAFVVRNAATDPLLVIAAVLFLAAALVLATRDRVNGHKLTNLALALLSIAFLFTTP